MEERSFYYRYCIIIPNSYPNLIQYFENAVKSYDFAIHSFEEDKKKYICLSQTNEQRMLKEAEDLKIKKPKIKEIKEDENKFLDKRIIELEKKDYFIADKYNDYIAPKEFNELYEITEQKKDDVNKRFGLGIFTESEMLYIEKSILENIPITNLEEFSKLLEEEIEKGRSDILKELNINININKNKKPIIEENSLFETLESNSIIEDYFPLHIGDMHQIFEKKLFSKDNPSLTRSYFNDEVALYFSWVNHYTKFVIFPAIVSSIMYLCSKFISNKIFESLRIIYALSITIWVQFFIIFWNRKESALKVMWDNDSRKIEKEDKRKEFKGDINQNIINGGYELYYSEKKQIINYLKSIVVSFIFLCIAVYINIISLNMRGLIPEGRHQFLVIEKYRNTDKKKTSIFFFIKKSIALNIFGSIYNTVNKKLTENENHRSKTQYYNSYIIKKFIFDSLNYFFELFYIAFALKDLDEIAYSMRFYFYSGKVFKLIAELALPFIDDVLFMTGEQKPENNFEKRFLLGEEIDQKEVIKQANYSKYNSFSHYYHLIQDFCFLTLFASCAPLAPILIWFNNDYEIKNKINKFFKEIRRPDFVKKKNIGAWRYIIECIGIMSIITNIMFCYLYNNSFGEKKYSLLSFMILEHILVLFIIALRFFFPMEPWWVKIYKLRKFLHRKDSLKIKSEKINEIKETI